MYVREDDPHGAAIQNLLHKAIAALVRHSHKGCDASQECGAGQFARVINGQSRVLKVNEERIVARVSCELDYLRVGADANTE